MIPFTKFSRKELMDMHQNLSLNPTTTTIPTTVILMNGLGLRGRGTGKR